MCMPRTRSYPKRQRLKQTLESFRRQEDVSLDPGERRKMFLQTRGLVRKAVSSRSSVCGYCPFLLTSPGAFGGSSLVPVGATKMLTRNKQIADISPASLCLGSAENYNLGSATMASYVRVPPWKRKKNGFIDRKRQLGGLWEKIHGHGVTCPSQEGKFFLFPVGLCNSHRA